MEIQFREIAEDDLSKLVRLKPKPEQASNVAPNAISLAEAGRSYGEAWPRAILWGDTYVGFVMLEVLESHCELWRLMLDASVQGRGLGRRVMDELIELVRGWGYSELRLSVVPGPSSPQGFYEKLGFSLTGREDDGELEMALTFERDLSRPEGLASRDALRAAQHFERLSRLLQTWSDSRPGPRIEGPEAEAVKQALKGGEEILRKLGIS